MGLNHSNSEWYNPNVMFVFLRIAWARSPVNRKEIVLTAFIYSFIILIKAGSIFNFFKKWEYPKGGGGYFCEFLVKVCSPFRQILTLFLNPLPPNPRKMIIIFLGLGGLEIGWGFGEMGFTPPATAFKADHHSTIIEDQFTSKKGSLPTRSLWSPLSTEFQFHETLDLQFVQPSWCLLVKITYLHNDQAGNRWKWSDLV